MWILNIHCFLRFSLNFTVLQLWIQWSDVVEFLLVLKCKTVNSATLIFKYLVSLVRSWLFFLQQKLAKRENVRIDRNQDIEQLWEFYKLYKRRHRVDDIQRQEQNLRESGTFSSEYGQLVPLINFLVIVVVYFCTIIFLAWSSKLTRIHFLCLYTKHCTFEVRLQSTFNIQYIFNKVWDACISMKHPWISRSTQCKQINIAIHHYISKHIWLKGLLCS